MAQSIFSPEDRLSGFTRRISWGAIFAGVVVVLVSQLMLGLVALAVGAASMRPLEGGNVFSGLTLGSAFSLAITTLVSLFLGGWVSARIAAMPERTESVLHGVVTWGLASLATFYLVTSVVTGALSGAAGVLGQLVSAVGQSAKQMAPELAKAAGVKIDDSGLPWKQIRQEAETLLRQTKKWALQPEAVKRQAANAQRDVEATASQGIRNPDSVDDEVASLWDRIQARGENLIQAADRDALANVLSARTGMSRSEALATVDKWQGTLQAAKARFEELKASSEQKARELADSTARSVARAAAWTFVALLLGLIAAAFGGYVAFASVKKGWPLRRSMLSTESAAA